MGLFPAPQCCCKALIRCAFSCKSPVIVYTDHNMHNSMGCYSGVDTSACVGECANECAVLYVEAFLPHLPDGFSLSVKGWLCWDGVGWSGAGTLGSQWSVNLSYVTDGTGCRKYTIERAELLLAGDRIVWHVLEHCPPEDFGAPRGMVVDATDTKYFDEGCPDIIANWHHAILPAEPPESVTVTVSGATGVCCEAINGTHVLHLNYVTENLTSPCLEAAGRRDAIWNFRKEIATPAPDCPTGNILAITAALSQAGCRLDCVVTIGRIGPNCSREWQLSVCPFCLNGTLDLSAAAIVADSPCAGGATCDLSAAAISGEIPIGTG